ncbi:KH domain-containing protein [Camelliibacillus cellulosilyticus]|uniref:RNA-binding protein KhpA n=1 Tax=Camelliibacillus cellulosilyticus TaxID=2174486 RepID=A0ABV9GKY8_9BACL
MDELVKAIVKPFLDHPDDVRVASERTDAQVTYILTVNKEDMGKVIGKKGRMIQAIRTVVHAAGLAHHEHVGLSVRE